MPVESAVYAQRLWNSWRCVGFTVAGVLLYEGISKRRDPISISGFICFGLMFMFGACMRMPGAFVQFVHRWRESSRYNRIERIRRQMDATKKDLREEMVPLQKGDGDFTDVASEASEPVLTHALISDEESLEAPLSNLPVDNYHAEIGAALEEYEQSI